MATITPTGDQRQITNVTSFLIGDLVQAISGPDAGKIGTIVTPDGLVKTLITPPLPALPYFAFLPQPGPAPVPLAVPASPTTSTVNVTWNDGTASLIALSLLRRV